MPISLQIAHDKRRVRVAVEGPVNLIDGLKTIGTIVASGAVPYGKVIDLTFAPLSQGAKGIRQMSQRVAQLVRGRKPGPLAFVVRSDLAMEMIGMFDAQVRADRPLKIFTDAPSAEAWLDGLAAS